MSRMWESFWHFTSFPQALQRVPKEKRVKVYKLWKTFINEVVLRQHVIKYHETQKCSICDLELAKAALSRHKKTHFEIKFECETCDKVYNRSDNLQKHKLICGTDIVKVVEAPVTINCETCGKSFTKKRYLQQHRRAHGGAKKMVQYYCKFCDFA